MTADPTNQRPSHFAFGPFVLMPERQVLTRDGAIVRLGSRALDILTMLVERPGELVGKAELMARVWPSTLVVESNIKVNMASLRRVLGEATDGSAFIATVAGRGYRFVAPVERLDPADPTGEESAAPPRQHNLPFRTGRVFGRSDDIDAVKNDLETSRLVSIVGAGGIGKRRWRSRWPSSGPGPCGTGSGSSTSQP